MLRHAREGRENKRDWRAHVFTRTCRRETSVSERELPVLRANWNSLRSSLEFSRNASARVRTSAVPNETGLLKEPSEFFTNYFYKRLDRYLENNFKEVFRDQLFVITDAHYEL